MAEEDVLHTYNGILVSHTKELDHESWTIKKAAMLCYAKSLQSCPTLCDPIDGTQQAPLSLGFSRQEY